MNKIIKLFTPSDEKLSEMSFNDLQQLPVAILAIVFALHTPDNVFEIYRSICFIIVMAIFNQLFAISKRQLGIFFGASSVIWLAAIFILFPDFFKLDFKETVAAKRNAAEHLNTDRFH